MHDGFRRRWRKFETSDGGRLTLVVTGMFLMAISPIIGALPGPGFIIVFPLGLGMTLKYSRWANADLCAVQAALAQTWQLGRLGIAPRIGQAPRGAGEGVARRLN